MLLRKEVTHATDLDLLTAIIGNRRTATNLFAKAHFSLFALLHSMPHENGDLFCAEGTRAYAPDPIMKLLAARELATRAISEDLQGRSALTSPGAVRDLLKLELATLPHEVFICIGAGSKRHAAEFGRGHARLTARSAAPSARCPGCA